MANSPTQIVLIPEAGGWESFAGQLLVGEMNQPRILRVMPEVVNGVWQGACMPHIHHPALGNGCHRMVFDKTGRLWTGHTHRSWAGGDQLRRIKALEGVPFTVQDIRITPSGFRLAFTKPVDAASAPDTLFSTKRYRYRYHSGYGSPQIDTGNLPAGSVAWNDARTEVNVFFQDFAADFIYEFTFKGLKAGDGEALLHETLCYTARQLPQ
jgi:hypothetical protein